MFPFFNTNRIFVLQIPTFFCFEVGFTSTDPQQQFFRLYYTKDRRRKQYPKHRILNENQDFFIFFRNFNSLTVAPTTSANAKRAHHGSERALERQSLFYKKCILRGRGDAVVGYRIKLYFPFEWNDKSHLFFAMTSKKRLLVT